MGNNRRSRTAPEGARFSSPRRGRRLICAAGTGAAAPGRAQARRRRGMFFRIHHSADMIARPQLSLRGHTFFCLARKKYAKKRRRTRNSADAQKGVSFRCACCRFSFRRPNALRAASSQAPYPSPRRKRQVSSISLLVLSKTQTLRWFVFWFLWIALICAR